MKNRQIIKTDGTIDLVDEETLHHLVKTRKVRVKNTKMDSGMTHHKYYYTDEKIK